MRAKWIQSEKLTVQHVGKPSHWMPNTHVAGSEGPDNALPNEAVFDHGITHDKTYIVEDKLMGSDFCKNHNGKQTQDQAEQGGAYPRSHSWINFLYAGLST